MPRATDTFIRINRIDDRTAIDQFLDGNKDPLSNAESVLLISGENTAGAAFERIKIKILTQVAPLSSGTRYAFACPGSEAIDIVAGKLYIKTSAVGATDAWVVAGAQT
jgi:hypothetical protein